MRHCFQNITPATKNSVYKANLGSDKSGCPPFNRECMEHNVTSFRILPSLECFLHYFQTRITATKFE